MMSETVNLAGFHLEFIFGFIGQLRIQLFIDIKKEDLFPPLYLRSSCDAHKATVFSFVLHYEIPWCIPTAISENFIPNNLIHPVKDGEHICDQFYLFTLNNVFHRFSLEFLKYCLFKLQSPVWGGGGFLFAYHCKGPK